MSKPRIGAGKSAAPKGSTQGTKWGEDKYTQQGYGRISLRLPLDVLDHLTELADEGGVSRAEIIDSLVRLEWATTPGRKPVSRADKTAAEVAGKGSKG